MSKDPMVNNVIKKENLLIGFIGQGWIGKNYADEFESRGFSVVRYGLEGIYLHNKDRVAEADIVFIAVPTPTTKDGFDISIVESVLPLVGKGKIAVIKSTLLPGSTEELQKKFPGIILLHSPEFLSVVTAKQDTVHPARNIIGVPILGGLHKKAAELVMSILPESPFESIVSSREAELIKYSRNCAGYARIVFSNILFDLSEELGTDWRKIEEAISADPDFGPTYSKPLHKSGRGAGGECFIKDFAAFRGMYNTLVDNPEGQEVLNALEKKNIKLLRNSKKDITVLEAVYGNEGL